MPIYEYACQDCARRFERLVRSQAESNATTRCPGCNGANVERLVSLFSASSDTTRHQNLKHGRKLLDRSFRDKRRADAEDDARHHH